MYGLAGDSPFKWGIDGRQSVPDRKNQNGVHVRDRKNGRANWLAGAEAHFDPGTWRCGAGSCWAPWNILSYLQ